MAMAYSTTLDPTSYTQQLKDFIKLLEGETFQPYAIVHETVIKCIA